MKFPTLWRYLQTVDSRLFAAVEEILNWVRRLDKPFCYVACTKNGIGSSLRAFPEFSDVVFDTHSEFNVPTNTWNPSRLGLYRLDVRIELNGSTISSGDFYSLVMYDTAGASPGVPYYISIDKAHTANYSTVRVSCLFRVTKPSKQYRLALVTVSTAAVQYLGADAQQPDKTYFSAEFVRGFN